ncbi:pseudouridine synthase, RluA family [Sphaerobacter thermophilus DSM 20745]|uniref:Pseudouridine synthase n=2 Tax=Sphaerobacter TaxID=2056 RepID=D1C122_SPHTD|nr:pseudouridine synthase, RluA family [Sphaerobacter thermophilus DSM 20745]
MGEALMEDAVRIVLDVAAEEDGERLDRLIAARVAEISRSYAQSLVKAGDVYVNGEPARPARRIHEGDTIEILLPPVPEPDDLTPEYIPVPVIYEDDDVIIFDKPAGLVTHPAPGHEHGTLVNVVKALRPDVPLLMGGKRPGIVHRLDKDTSGLIVVAKNEEARRYLVQQWQQRDVVKRYIALVHGVIRENEGTIDAPISRDPRNRKRMAVVPNGRPAVTHFRVLERFRDATLLNVQIETGRTHQIRVHMLFIGHPIVGDQMYGKRPFRIPIARQFLHASYLKFSLPESGRPIEVETALPADLREVLERLRAEG